MTNTNAETNEVNEFIASQFPYNLSPEEQDELVEEIKTDHEIFKLKELLKRKKQEIDSLYHGEGYLFQNERTNCIHELEEECDEIWDELSYLYNIQAHRWDKYDNKSENDEC